MQTIKSIKDTCIAIDLVNIENGDKSIGITIGGKFIQFKEKDDVEIFYSRISLKDLLIIYSQYMGLSCLISDGESLSEHGYTIDILELIENL